jgi:hypothetical protein
MHENRALLRDSVEILMHLSLNPNNAVRLNVRSACGSILKALENHLIEYEFGVEVCSGAILNLITYGSNTSSAKTNLLESNGFEVLQKAKSSTRASARARESIVRITELLNFNLDGKQSCNKTISDPYLRSSSSSSDFVGVILGSEFCNGATPLQVELRREYSSLDAPIDSTGSDSLDNNDFISYGKVIEM